MDLKILVEKWNEFGKLLQDDYNELCNDPKSSVAGNYVQMMWTFENFMGWLGRNIETDKQLSENRDER